MLKTNGTQRKGGQAPTPLPLLAHSSPPAPKGLETPRVGRTLPPDLVTEHLLCAHLSRGQHLIGEATPAALGMEGENSHRGARGPHQAACPPVTIQVQGPRADLHAVIRGRAPSGGTIPRAAGPRGAGRCRRLHHRNKALIPDDTSPAFQNGTPGRYACLPGRQGSTARWGWEPVAGRRWALPTTRHPWTPRPRTQASQEPALTPGPWPASPSPHQALWVLLQSVDHDLSPCSPPTPTLHAVQMGQIG